MRLTRKKAIELCIELWTWLAKTGKEDKSDWPGWLKYYASVKIAGERVWGYCWFCEYDERQKEREKTLLSCSFCPLVEIFGIDGCTNKQCYFKKWERAKTPRTRKKYSKLFLNQIRSIK